MLLLGTLEGQLHSGQSLRLDVSSCMNGFSAKTKKKKGSVEIHQLLSYVHLIDREFYILEISLVKFDSPFVPW